ncbi:hypothetical protein M3603_15240 [Rummeliibacillus stabekisii]|uniref:hypothetical protein n=1 Tax=Rummeliibacillus stabekisii TaxID=241244 RepID=UPI00203D09A0|nr:hypothetical protein [Rummeliibacillus stabekisii]MCM3317972.1 hypothetical protein [Rummeliibacillus stabekisii]
MENNTTDALEFGVNILLFLAAATYIVYSFLDLPKIYDVLKGPETVYMQESEVPATEDLWSGVQVIAKIYRIGDDEVPITVDGVTFKDESDLKNKQSNIDVKKHYYEEIKYDDDGNISEIVFKPAS